MYHHQINVARDMNADGHSSLEQERIRLLCDLLTQCVTICNRASTCMKQHSQEHGWTTLALKAYAEQLSSLLSELERISEVVDEKWVSI